MNDFEPFEPPVDLAALDRMLDAARSRANHPTARPVERRVIRRYEVTLDVDELRRRGRWLVRRVREVVYVARHGMTQGDDW